MTLYVHIAKQFNYELSSELTLAQNQRYKRAVIPLYYTSSSIINIYDKQAYEDIGNIIFRDDIIILDLMNGGITKYPYEQPNTIERLIEDLKSLL